MPIALFQRLLTLPDSDFRRMPAVSIAVRRPLLPVRGHWPAEQKKVSSLHNSRSLQVIALVAYPRVVISPAMKQLPLGAVGSD